MHQLYLVKLHLGRHILKARRTQISQRAQLRPVSRFNRGHQVEPSVVVEIDRSDSPTCGQVLYRQRDAFKALALHIAPQRNAWAAGVGESYIHPPILIEIEHHCSHRRRQAGLGIKRRRLELAFARVGKEGGRCAGTRYQ